MVTRKIAFHSQLKLGRGGDPPFYRDFNNNKVASCLARSQELIGISALHNQRYILNRSL